MKKVVQFNWSFPRSRPPYKGLRHVHLFAHVVQCYSDCFSLLFPRIWSLGDIFRQDTKKNSRRGDFVWRLRDFLLRFTTRNGESVSCSAHDLHALWHHSGQRGHTSHISKEVGRGIPKPLGVSLQDPSLFQARRGNYRRAIFRRVRQQGSSQKRRHQRTLILRQTSQAQLKTKGSYKRSLSFFVYF